MKKKLKVFKVWADHYDYDQYDSFIIIGRDEESILKQFETDERGNRIYRGPIDDSPFSKWSRFKYVFKPDQGEIHIKEIDITIPALILGSYNAG